MYVFQIVVFPFCSFSFGYCVVCSSLIYGIRLPLWYLLVIVLYVLLRYTESDYPFGIFWPLCCLFFFDIRNPITPVVSFGHCVVCSSSIYGFRLPLWYLHGQNVKGIQQCLHTILYIRPLLCRGK
jgi:hypothetical protein